MLDSPKPSLKERQWKLREDAILDAVSELLSTKGYNAMTMDDIANLVGISKATLYLHFSSKHDLVVSVACRTIDRSYELLASIDPNLPASKRLEQMIDRAVEIRFGSEHISFNDGVGEIVEILSQEHPFREKEARNTRFILEVVSAAQAEGATVPGVSPVVVVHMILGALRGVDIERAVDRGETNPAEIAESMKRLILRG